IGKAKYPTVNNVTCYVEGENTKLKDQVLKFDGKDASPKRVGLNIPFSNRAVRNATLDLLSYARKVEVQAAAQLLNKWMFSTTTIEGCSAGPFVAPFAEATEKEKGALAFEDIVSLETTIEAKDVVIDETAAYVVHPTIYGFLKTTKLDEGSGKFLIEGGMMNGYPVLRSSHVSEKVIGFGVFSNVDVLQYGDVDVTVDQLTRKNENITQVMFQTDYDIVTVRQEAFACIKIA
ncbi:MAG: phage major capsid protein, partial [Bacteroidales bacterium]